MTQNRLADYLDHMLEATLQACSYIEGVNKVDFLARHPDVPWRNMKGMRNRIAHGYFDIDLDVVWDTLQTALSALLERLPAIREDANSPKHD